MLNTHDYIKCFDNTFWRWDSEDRFVCIRNGGTFAHWDEVQSHIIGLSPMGLPLFDVYMSILAATSDDPFVPIAQSIQKGLMNSSNSAESNRRLSILHTIGEVDKKYKTGDNRFVLLATVLEKANVKMIDNVSGKISSDLSDPEQDFFGRSGKEAIHHLKKVINCLSALGSEFPTPDSIIEAMKGFDMSKLSLDNILPDSSEQNPSEELSFIEQLNEESRTTKIAALIPYVMSGLNFPIHATQSENRPDGGVSDLSNKGHFDQLIISEFAYDEDYFLSRIVNNEALFYQREKAKNDNDNDVCVLIDASLYMWGLPKLIATAIGCSVGLKDEKVAFDCYLVGDNAYPCDFRTIEGVLKGIRTADASICPVNGLNQFVDYEHVYANTIFVTSEESWSRPEMVSFKENGMKILDFFIFVNEQSEINVFKSKGKQIANFKLDLDTIWELNKNNKIRTKKPVLRGTYPILFPKYEGRTKFSFSYHDQHFFIDKSQALFTVIKDSENNRAKGARYIMSVEHNLEVLGDLGLNEKGELELLLFNRKDRFIFIYNLVHQTVLRIDFPKWRSKNNPLFYHENNQFYFVTSHGYLPVDHRINETKELLPRNDRMFSNALARMREIKMPKRGDQVYMKHVTSVYLSNQGELVVQGKRIEALSNKGGFSFENTPNGSEIYSSNVTKSDGLRVFTFDSGEQVIVNPSGIIEFKFQENFVLKGYDLRLMRTAEHKLVTIKLVREFTGKGLRECQEIVNNTIEKESQGSSIVLSIDSQVVKANAAKLREHGNQVRISTLRLENSFFMTSTAGRKTTAMASNSFFSGNTNYKDDALNSQQRTIDSIDFYSLYLKAFIQNIQDGIKA